MNYTKPQQIPDNSLFITAHPDDEVMVAAALSSCVMPGVIVATDGEASSLDFSGRCLC
jgi:LmbE family N-acetylglucosaminyl deacetylase